MWEQTILKIWAVLGGRKWGGNGADGNFGIWLEQILYLKHTLALLESSIEHVITMKGILHRFVEQGDIVV